MAYPSVISHRARRRKRQQRKWAFVRGFITFLAAFAVLLLSAWQDGDLRRRDRQAHIAAVSIRPVLAEPLAPPAQQTLASPMRRVRLPALETGPAVAEELEVLSANELAAISQAHRARPTP